MIISIDSFFFFFKIYLFIFIFGFAGLHCCTWAFSGCRERRLLFFRGTCSRLVGFSHWGSWTLQCRLSSCDAQDYLLHGTWDFPGPRIESMSPVLAGRFLTTRPPAKPSIDLLIYFFVFLFDHCYFLPSVNFGLCVFFFF